MKNNLDIEYKGFGIAVNQSPAAGSEQKMGHKIFIELEAPSFE